MSEYRRGTGNAIKNCLFVMHKNESEILKESQIEKAIYTRMEYSVVYHRENKYHGKVVFFHENDAKAALKEFQILKFYCRYWRDSDEIDNKMDPSHAQKPSKVAAIESVQSSTLSVTATSKSNPVELPSTSQGLLSAEGAKGNSEVSSKPFQNATGSCKKPCATKVGSVSSQNSATVTSKTSQSKGDNRVKTCLLVKYRYRSKFLTRSHIAALLKGHETGIQRINVYHVGNQYYGKVMFINKEYSKAAVMECPKNIFEVRYWRTTDKSGIEVEPSSVQSVKELAVTEHASGSCQNTLTAVAVNSSSKEFESRDNFSTNRGNSKCGIESSAIHDSSSGGIAQGNSRKPYSSESAASQGSSSSAIAKGGSREQEPCFSTDAAKKGNNSEMSCTGTTKTPSQDSFSDQSTAEQSGKEKLSSYCKLVEVTTIEELFPCSKELMAYLVHRFYEKDFKKMWKSIEPVEVYPEGRELFVKGTSRDIQMAKTKVLEHPSVRGLHLEFIPNLRKGNPQKVCKKISAKFSKTVLFYIDDSCEPLLYSKSLSELQEAKKFLENIVPQTKIYNINAGIQFNNIKLNNLIASLKYSCVDVTVKSPNLVIINSLCKEDFESSWHQIQQCFIVVTETVYITNFQLTKLRRDFNEKASSLSCRIVIADTSQDLNDCVPIIVRGYSKKEVKEAVAYILSKCTLKERIVFKDIFAGHVITSTQLGKWSSYARNKNIHLTILKTSCGFLVEGNPKPVKEAIQSLLQNYHGVLECPNYISYGQVVLKSFYKPVCTTEKISEWKRQVKSTYMADVMFSLLSGDQPKDVREELLRVSKDHVVTIKIVIGRFSKEDTDAIVIPTDRVQKDKIYPIQLTCLQTESFQDGYKRCLHGYQALNKTGETEILDSGSLPCTRILHIIYPLTDLVSSKESDLVNKSLCFASKKRIGSISFPDVGSQMISSVISSLTSLDSRTIHTVRVVVGSEQQAKRYAGVLHKAASPSPTSSSIRQADRNDRNMLKKYQWSWKDDNGVLVSYDSVSSDLLNQAYQKDCSGTCALQVRYQHYTVDFQTMKQRNISSLHEREVIRSFPKLNISQQSVTWKYWDDSGRFSAYLPGDSAQVEIMYQKRDNSDFTIINSRTYSFDFNSMLQVNAETGYSRDIKREVAVTDNCDQTNISFQSGFLHENDEVIIVNFRSPSECFQNVKTYIQDRLEEQLSSEDINLTVPCLPDHLEAIVKKHSMVSCEITTAGPTQGKRTVLRVKGLQALVQKAQTELQKAIIDSLSPTTLVQPPLRKTQYPHTWEPMSEGEQCKIVRLTYTSYEYSDVSARFMETMSDFEVVEIQRVQNKWIWERYSMTKRRMSEKNNGRDNELELFHGSRTAPAESICNSEEGFDMRFSREGLWGQANYFAKNASYSDGYAYYIGNGGMKEIMLAQVLTGDSHQCKPDKSLRMPPEKNSRGSDRESKFIQRYDSVCGMANNCKVYMTYCNENAYPAYIIKYAADDSGATGIKKYPSRNPAKAAGLQQPTSSMPPNRVSAKPPHSYRTSQQPSSFQVPYQPPSQQQPIQVPSQQPFQVPYQPPSQQQPTLVPSQQPSSFQVPPSQQQPIQSHYTTQAPRLQPSSYQPTQPSMQPPRSNQPYPSNPQAGNPTNRTPPQKKRAREPRQAPSSCIIS